MNFPILLQFLLTIVCLFTTSEQTTDEPKTWLNSKGGSEFGIFKYLGYGLDMTRFSLYSYDDERNFTTNLLGQLFNFVSSGESFQVPLSKIAIPVPTFIKNGLNDGPKETALLMTDVYLFDNMTDWIFPPKYTDNLVALPLNFSKQYLQAHTQGEIVAQVFLIFCLFFILFIYYYL